MLSDEIIRLLGSGCALIAISYPILSLIYQLNPAKDMNKMSSFRRSIPLLLVLLAVKLRYDYEFVEPNLYSIMGVSRHCRPFELRQAFKYLSLLHHPDKSPVGSESDFYVIRAAYDVLKDEHSRDIYNHFGGNSLEFDPRLDEVALCVDTCIVYLFWAVIVYVFTVPASTRASRSWIAIFGVVTVVFHVMFDLGGVDLPDFLKTTALSTMTEHELILLLQSVFPAVAVCLIFLAEALYFDLNRYTLLFLEKSVQRNKELHALLERMRGLANNRSADPLVAAESSSELASSLEVVASKLTTEDEEMAQIFKAFKEAGAANGTNYYGIIFIVMFVIAQMM
mmetsp:Transcript_36578/g.68103  ORF Transcript_36578/g.68103 Transcript_36578/m.68103 type:complete len:338 (-) Transcript_36578:87-1100(-)